MTWNLGLGLRHASAALDKEQSVHNNRETTNHVSLA